MPTNLAETETEHILGLISPDKKIGEGRFREAYRVGDTVVKIMKPYVCKNYGLFTIRYPARLYIRCKFGINDFNAFEYEQYKRLQSQFPKDLQGTFAKLYGTVGPFGNSISIAELVKSANGEPSKTLACHGKVKDSRFWEQLGALEQFLLDESIPLMDIRAENILVKELPDEKIIPVLIDYKCGRRMYPFQPDLWFPSRIRAKIERRFVRIRENYWASGCCA
jgi:hypothetical protein